MVYEAVWFGLGCLTALIAYFCVWVWVRRGAIVCGLMLPHRWAYAQGRGKGAISGGVRPLCFRRACTRCGKIQEISHYDWLPYHIGRDGVEYRGNPIWVTQKCVDGKWD